MHIIKNNNIKRSILKILIFLMIYNSVLSILGLFSAVYQCITTPLKHFWGNFITLILLHVITMSSSLVHLHYKCKCMHVSILPDS